MLGLVVVVVLSVPSDAASKSWGELREILSGRLKDFSESLVTLVVPVRTLLVVVVVSLGPPRYRFIVAVPVVARIEGVSWHSIVVEGMAGSPTRRKEVLPVLARLSTTSVALPLPTREVAIAAMEHSVLVVVFAVVLALLGVVAPEARRRWKVQTA